MWSRNYILKSWCRGTLLLVLLCVAVACSDEQKPDGLLPELTVYAATDVTRNSATVSGRVVVPAGVEVSSCCFVCTSVVAGEQVAKVSAIARGELVEGVLDGLKAGHDYSYYLEVSNKQSKITSEPQAFVTLPNTCAVIANLAIVGKGLISVTVQCDLLDDGGLPVEVGFRVCEKASGTELKLSGTWVSGQLFKGESFALSPNSSFAIYAFAANELGEVRSEELLFETSSAILVHTPGTLSEYLQGEMRYQLPELTVAGKLNGTDIRLIRDLLGRGPSGESTPGKLRKLNLYDAEIVAGGVNYADSRYAVNHTLGTGMFQNCTSLEELVLPSTLEVVEADALKGCLALKELHLPSSVTAFTPSEGCAALAAVSVSALNKTFCSADGVLYDKEGGSLLFYPEGRTADRFVVPATVHNIGEYAFRKASVAQVDLPRTVNSLNANAFHHSLIEEIALPGIVTVPYAAFQSCTRLQKVTLGPFTEVLSDYCFDGCPLRDIYVEANYPPVCRATAFSPAGVYQEAVVHVLPSCKSLYRLSDSWKTFQRFVEDATTSN